MEDNIPMVMNHQSPFVLGTCSRLTGGYPVAVNVAAAHWSHLHEANT